MCAAADRGFTWSDDETSLLLRLWGDGESQSELVGNKRNFVVYERISEIMSSVGYVRTASQCREKIKRMKREYTVTKQFNERTEGPKKVMRFFDQFEAILLEKQLSKNLQQQQDNPSAESEDAASSKSKSKRRCRKSVPTKLQSQEEVESLIDVEPVGDVVGDKETENSWTANAVLPDQEDTPTVETNTPMVPVTYNNVQPDRKRKMEARASFFQSVMETVTVKFMKYQNESDERFLNKIEELEQERMRMEEKTQKMWLDFEERRRIDEKKHEENVMRIFQNIMTQAKTNNIAKE